MVGPDQVRTQIDPQVARVDPSSLQQVYFASHSIQVDDCTCAQQAAYTGIEDTAWHQVKGKAPMFVDDSMSRIVATLKADHPLCPGGEVIDDPPFALITPLGTNYNGDSQDSSLCPRRLTPGLPAALFCLDQWPGNDPPHAWLRIVTSLDQVQQAPPQSRHFLIAQQLFQGLY